VDEIRNQQDSLGGLEMLALLIYLESFLVHTLHTQDLLFFGLDQ
jgi:hypothetical protein